MKYRVILEVDDQEASGKETKEELERIWMEDIMIGLEIAIEKATVDIPQ